MKKIFACDVDQTLNVAKTPITLRMAATLIECMKKNFIVAPISGQKFDQFLRQIVDPLRAAGITEELLESLHLFPCSGSQYYRYDSVNKDWQKVYSYDLTVEQIAEMTWALKTAAEECRYWYVLTNGDQVIEDRGAQVTYSALGQHAGTEEKYAWDPDCTKRAEIVKRAKELAPAYMYEIGGTTSINAMLRNKSFGMEQLMEHLKVKLSDVIYFGDATEPPYGNDHCVVEMGFDVVTVRDWVETANILEGILLTQ